MSEPNAETSVENELTVAVISDLHAYGDTPPEKAPSHFCITENDPAKNPLPALHQLIATNKLKADLLLCPGDLGDKAHPISIQHAWTEIHKLKARLYAATLAVTTGNHDIDSRYAHNGYDAKGMLQALDPKYPSENEAMNDRYWSRHFFIISTPRFRLVILNSSAFHGEGQYDKLKRPEYEQGRISDHTLRMLKQELENTPRAPVNLLLCHHHPHPHSELHLGEDDLMMNGQALIELLGTARYGPWMIIHGHKHHPKLEYAAGGTSSPLVFAAGSLCAILWGEMQTAARNQFYLLHFPLHLFEQYGWVGRFSAWDWCAGTGWIPSPKGMMLPQGGGFGWRGDLNVLARQVASKVTQSSMKWDDLIKHVPQLAYLLPSDLRNLIQLINLNHNLSTQPEDEAPPFLIGRVT